MNVIRVYKKNGFVFHDGYIEEGSAKSNKVVEVIVNQVSYSLHIIIVVKTLFIKKLKINFR